MDCVSAGDFARRQYGRDVEVAVLCRRGANADALVGKAHVHRIRISGGMHGHGRNAELLAGAQDPKRDFAAIGDEDFIEHSSASSWGGRETATSKDVGGKQRCAFPHSIITSGSPNSTGCPSSNRT